MLCPFFVPTGIVGSDRNRPADASAGSPTRSQIVGSGHDEQGGESGKVSAVDVAGMVFNALRKDRFYIYSHPHALASVQTRLDDVVQVANPSDPFAHSRRSAPACARRCVPPPEAANVVAMAGGR